MSTPSPPDEGLSPERLTETLRRSGGLDGGRVVEVAVETSRPTLVSIIQRLRPRCAPARRACSMPTKRDTTDKGALSASNVLSSRDIVVISLTWRWREAMAQVLIRNIDDGAISRLKARARRKGVSLERELRAVLTESSRLEDAGFRGRAAAFRRKLAGRRHSDSTRLIRDDRDR